MSKQFNARRLDVKAFAEEAGALAGRDAVRDHPRLLAETQGRSGETAVNWALHGELRNPRHVRPQAWLHLEADTVLSLTCQRCLQPVEVPVSVQRSFRFVEDEATASAEDEESEEDVLALSRSFDALELVEDELLMDLPLAPRHETCAPVQMTVADADFEAAEAPKDNPFAVLGRLKGPAGGGRT